MKKTVKILLLSILYVMCLLGFAACDRAGESITPEPEIIEYFEKQSDGSYYGKVYNATTQFDFTGKIDYDGEYLVCTDAACTNPLADNKTSLNMGDNTFYILYDNGNKTTATVRRRVICTVNFDTANGTIIPAQTVEEDRRTPAPKNPMRLGYTFNAWDYDFNEPISENTTITALWNANTNTPYKVEYYLQNLEGDNYTLQENDTEYLTGTTDTTATASKIYENFTVIESTASAIIKPDGTTVLKVYYDLTEMFYFNFTSTATTCTITGVKDKTVTEIIVPDYVTDIGYQAFYGCSSLTSVTFGENSKLTSIGKFAFHNCSSLTSITIPDSITSIGLQAFLDCPLEYNKYENGLYLGNENNPFLVLMDTETNNKTNYIIYDCTKIIGYYAFWWCTSLKDIIIPDSVISVGYGAFGGCSSLTSIVIPDRETSSWGITKTNQNKINMSAITASSF